LSIEVKVYKRWFEIHMPEIQSTFETIKKLRGIIPESTEEAVMENLEEIISWLKRLLTQKKYLDYDSKLIEILEKIQELGEDCINFIHDSDLREKILEVIRLALIIKSEIQGDYERKKKIYGKGFEKYLPSKLRVSKLEPQYWESLLYQAARNVTNPEKKERATLSREEAAELLIQSYWLKKKILRGEDSE